MRARDWRLVGDEEILKSRADLKKELFALRVQAATEALENPARIRQIIKDLARIETVFGERAGVRGSGV
ncbi:MAG: 50S ribosomal protein L29 [Planctomycetes bacterium]|nr:50S ribosomal protein L29 [Planctomycetota bacterium]